MQTEIWMPTVEAVIIFIVILFLVAEYADRARTPTLVVIFTIFSWFMSFSMIMFIPLDIWLVSTISCCSIHFLNRPPSLDKIRIGLPSGGMCSTGAVSS